MQLPTDQLDGDSMKGSNRPLNIWSVSTQKNAVVYLELVRVFQPNIICLFKTEPQEW